MIMPWKKLSAKTIAIEKITAQNRIEMFNLYKNFYDNVSFDQFETDMLKKTSIILLQSKNKELKGFSTLTSYDIENNGRQYHIIYSGDTIIDPSYWGTAALTMEFLKNIMLAKLKRPLSPVWWFLISKGYKTYLLMANNFINYYPRFDKKTPKPIATLMKQLSEKLYPERYIEEKGILSFDDGRHERLRDFVAPITEQMKVKYPKIRFFAEKNQGWENGDELVCLGEVSLLLAVVHPLKILNKTMRKFGLKLLAPFKTTP
ncbi:MAG: hypothetical protein COW00_13250 [Bdellovibrio sp. CG12_big_fil_rev_8_21_14_0_65_39_13]|nr:MAG: hypothetical protein COW78_11300 [Bdellovibrio sp. CG22_combo_CG10-13_8_21_14_all_39_27]PIQ58896.1 MAG: hypothetical protein COW00_13250 [Bdellovibrio sp. CG12_big_fil_rev_8_21_14_0_65_39_13]PIR35987.1 MAG: hypothetical protein COV37_05625 [Bdellovibrio sp. CG11_big_fil_rev_8_21_14_0_20_39_38]PJB53915.1 MAG: hypothetical protein CO099_04565 [Bdellovibrio sp. CG_4_9_14_3_um_filter_39_7]